MMDKNTRPWFFRLAHPRIWSALGALLLTAYYFAPATAVLDVTLDSSNYGTYSAFTAEGRQYGTEVLPMAGPYGFVMYGWTYGGHLYWPRFGLELLVKLGFALLVLWLWRETPARWLRWWWLATLLLVPNGAAELVYDLTVLLAGLYLSLNYTRTDRLRSSCAVVGLLALLALSKGTLLILATAILGLIALQATASRRFRRLIWATATFGLAITVFWLAAGQNPFHLPGFAHGINELSRGYNEAMGLLESSRAFATGCGTLIVLEALAAMLAWSRRRDPGGVAAAILLAAFAFLKWKHGFVRADGHVYIFYQYAIAAIPTTWLLFPARSLRGPGRLLRGYLPAALGLVGMGLAVYGPGDDPMGRLRWQTVQIVPRARQSIEALTAPRAAHADLERRLQENRAVFHLPGTRQAVGTASIDFFGFEHGYLALNGLNYQPRPMGGGSFNVFTPDLQARNARYVTDSATRPEFYLVNLETIDNRLLAQDDASTLAAIIAGYRPVLAEQGMLLLRARTPAPPPPSPRRLLSRSFQFGETIGLPKVRPDEMLLVSFDLPSSLRGRIRAAMYKPSPLYLSLSGAGILEPESRRLVPSLVSRPLILSPLLEHTTDLLTLYSRESGKAVTDLRVYAAGPEDFDQRGLAVTFYTAPRPEAISAADRAAFLEPFEFPMANRRPLRLEPPGQPRRTFDGLPVQMLETPGRLLFGLTATDRALSFAYGMDPECYTRGTTDGVEFSVELLPPNAPPQLLFRRALHPLTVPSDRGRHLERLVLPPFIAPGSQLALRTEPGPDRNSAWDWAYYTGIHFESGAYQAAQFPGFRALPTEVDAGYCGALLLANGQTVFMLNAPGRLQFTLDGRVRALVFQGGLLEGAYTEGNTDGAEFVVVLHHADGRAEELLRRWLRPKAVPADRGPQTFTVTLPPHANGDRLDVLTTAGPSGNLAWDWTYLAGLELR